MKKVIIDTDPGIDDAMALCYALAHPQLNVLALTTIFGNVAVGLAAQNALRLCELTGTSIPVALGAAKPLVIEPHPVADFVHGTNGFGNIELAAPTGSLDRRPAAELIVDMVREQPGEITLIPVGPLTNLATALELAPDIAGKVAEVIIMGGVFYREGNVSEFAEANIWNDPHAAKAVMTADWPVVMHGLDITYQIDFDRDYLDRLASASPVAGRFLRDAAEFYIKFYQQHHDFEGCCPHDLLAVAYATNPEWFVTETGNLDVTTEGTQIGRTTTSATTATANKRIALEVDRSALLSEYHAVVSRLPPS